MKRRAILFAAAVGLSVLCTWLVFRDVDASQLWEQMLRVNPWALLLFFPLQAAQLGLPALRSKVLFTPLHKFSLWQMVKSVLLAFSVNNVVPFRAGDAARIAYISRVGELKVATCVALVAFERMLDLLCLILILLFVLPAVTVDVPVGQSVYLIGGALLIAVSGCLWLGRRPETFVKLVAFCARPLGKRIADLLAREARKLTDGFAALQSPIQLVSVVVATLGFWIISAVILHMWLWAFDIDLPWYASTVLLTFVSLGLAVPSAPGNIGTYHYLVIEVLALLGVMDVVARPYAVVAHAMGIIPFTLIAIPILYRDYIGLRKAKTEPASE